MIFFVIVFFLSSFLSPSLDSINLLKFSKSHYQPCMGINSNIANAILFFDYGVCQETKRFFFGGGGEGEREHYSVTFNVSFTKLICISMSNRLNVFFSHLKKYLRSRW